MPRARYLSPEDIQMIKYLVAGKVTFGTDPNQSTTDEMLDYLVWLTESALAQQLSYRYDMAWCCNNGAPFSDLPETTRGCLVFLVQTQVILNLLGNVLGRKNGTTGEFFMNEMVVRFNYLMKANSQRDPSGKFMNLPLPGLKLSDAYNQDVVLDAPRIVTSGISMAPYVQSRLQNPSVDINFWIDNGAAISR